MRKVMTGGGGSRDHKPGRTSPDDLSAYADTNGYLDVQKLTCAQLAGTWQEDADKLRSGTADGTTVSPRSISTTPRAGTRLEHEVIGHCKANPEIRDIDAIAIILKDEKIARGIENKGPMSEALQILWMQSLINGALRECVNDRQSNATAGRDLR